MEVAGVFHFFLQDSLLQRSIKLASDIESDSMFLCSIQWGSCGIKAITCFLVRQIGQTKFILSENISCGKKITCRHMHLEVNALSPEGFLNIWRQKVISFSVINWKVLLNHNCLKGLSIICSPHSVAAVALYTLQTDYFKRSLISYVRYLWNVKAAIIQIQVQLSLCDNPYLASLLRNKTLFKVVDMCAFLMCIVV